LWVVFLRTILGYLICMAMSGNGAPTIGIITMKRHLLMVLRRCAQVGEVVKECYAVVLGLALPWSVDRLLAISMLVIFTLMTLVFELCTTSRKHIEKY
jgi:hypothetical protein